MSTTKRMVLVIGIAVFGLLAISALHRVEAQLNQEDFVSLATQGFLTAVDGDHPEGSRRNSYILKGCSKFFQLFVTLCGISSKAIV